MTALLIPLHGTGEEEAAFLSGQGIDAMNFAAFLDRHQDDRNVLLALLTCDCLVMGHGWQGRPRCILAAAVAARVGMAVLELPGLARVPESRLPTIVE